MAQPPSLGDPIDEYLADLQPTDIHVTVRGQSSAPDPIDVYLEEQERQRKAALTETLRPDVNPDQRAKDIQTSKAVGVPVSAVEHDRALMLQKARDGDPLAIQLLQTNPALVKWLTEHPDEAGAAKDDMPALVQLENKLTFGAGLVRSWDRWQGRQGRFAEATGDLLNSKKLRDYGQSVAEFNKQQDEALGATTEIGDIHSLGDFLQWVKEGISTNAVDIGVSTAGAVVGAKTGAVVGLAFGPASAVTVPVAATVGAAIGAFIPNWTSGVGEVQGTIKEIDKTAQAPGWAFVGGSAVAAFDTVLPGRIGSRLVRVLGGEGAEQVTRTALAQILKPQFIRSVTKEGAIGSVAEGITEGLQRGVQDWAASRGTGTPMDWAKTGRGMLEEAATGAVVGGVFSAGGVAATHSTEQRAYVEAQQQKAIFDALNAGTKDSLLFQRLPAAYGSYVASATKDGPIENVYMGADEFSTYWQSKDVNPHVIAAQLTGNPQALEQALEQGTKLVVPTAKYAEHLAGSEHGGFFAQELTFTPDGLNHRQAKEAQVEFAKLMDTIGDAVTKAAQGDAVLEKGGPLQQTITAQMLADPGFVQMAIGQGANPAAAANTSAAGWAAIFETVGARAGLDPMALYARYAPTFGEAVAAGAQAATMARPAAPGEATSAGVPVQVVDPAEAFLGGPEGPTARSLVDELSELELDEDARPEDEITELSQAPRLASVRQELGDEGLNAILATMPGAPAIEGEQLTAAGKRVPFTHVTAWLKEQDPEAIPDDRLRELVEKAQALAFPAPEPVEVPSLLRAPMDVSEGRVRGSTRVPTAVNAPVAARRLRTDFSVLEQSPKAYAKTAAWFRTLIQVPKAVQESGTDAEVFEAFMARGVANLRFLWGRMRPEWVDRAKLWYVGAHRISHAIADEHGFTDPQAAALLAVMSPKIDWFKNVAYARAAAKFFTFAEGTNPVFEKPLFDHYRRRVLDNFETAGVRKIRSDGKREGKTDEAIAAEIVTDREELKTELRDDRRAFQGQAWHSLSSRGQARMLRASVEQGDLNYQVIMPEGEDAGVKRNLAKLTAKQKRELLEDEDSAGDVGPVGQPSKMGWTSFPITETAIAIMRDGSLDNIQERLGGEHKVRSFFNNISDPWDPDSVTIDTHAVAAVHLQPFSSNSTEVVKTMSGFGDALLGLSGANNVYAEVYFRLAAQLSQELGRPVLAREVQSVTWEAVRLLYPPEQKREGAPARAQKIWDSFADGTMTEAGLYDEHQREPGQKPAPDWGDHPARVVVDEGQLRAGYGTPLFPDVPVGRGDRGGRAGGPPRRNAGIADGDVDYFAQQARTGAASAARASTDISLRRTAARSILGQLHRTSTRVYLREGRGRAKGIRGVEHRPSLQFSARFGGLYPTPKIIGLDVGPEAAAAFHDSITAAKAGSRYGAAVFVYERADYATMRLFLTEDGKHGFAIKADGDIVSVFSRGGGNVHAMLALAVQEGGTKLDCFETVLPDLYAVNGFKVVSRDTWNDAYTPEGWDHAAFKDYNDGRPDVVYMQYDPVALETGPTTLFQGPRPLVGSDWAHSKLTRAVELSDLQRASGQQWKATIKNAKIGVSTDEFAFAHVDDLANGTTYTKQEVLDYLKTNQLKVTWTVLGGSTEAGALYARTREIYDGMVAEELAALREITEESPGHEITTELTDEHGWQVRVGGVLHDWDYDTEEAARADGVSVVADLEEREGTTLRLQAIRNVSYEDAQQQARDELGPEAPFEEYTEPGAQMGTYREVLLQAPELGATGFAVLTERQTWLLTDAGITGAIRNITTDRQLGTTAINENVNEVLDSKLKIYDRSLKNAGNWGNQRDLTKAQDTRAAMQRLKDTQDFSWNQQGWVDGHSEYRHLANPIVRLRFNQRYLPDGQHMLFLEEVQPPTEKNQNKMPALLLKNWRELAFKWALAHAVEIGATSIGWTTGAMQAARYDLSTAVDTLNWHPAMEGTHDDATRTVRLHLEGGGWLDLQTDSDMKVVDAHQGHGRGAGDEQPQFVGKDLQSLVGKDMVEEIRSKAIGQKSAKEVSVGGEGLKRLYDQDFRNVVQKLPAVKRNGGKVELLTIPHGPKDDRQAMAAEELDLIDTGGAEFAEREREWDLTDRGAAPPGRPTAEVQGLVLTPEIIEAVAQGQTLFQNDKPVPGTADPERRGFITFQRVTGKAYRQINIGLLKGADLSTVLHETGHFYLELLGDITADLKLADPTSLAPGQAALLKDYQAILTWLGVTDRSEIGTDQHEQFARGFEAYLREGKAPSIELRGVFARYRAWLVALYKSAEDLQVVLTPEVRAVFDRMLASDAAIAEAQAEAQIEPFATAQEAGMTDIEFRAYRETAERANQQAREVLQARLFAEMQKERTALWKARRAAIQLEVQADVWSRREQIALSILTLGKMPSGAPAPNGSEDLKIAKASIVARFGKDRLSTLPKPWVYAVEGGVEVEQVAEVLGYASGEELLTDLARTAKPETVVKEETDARMKTELGDMRIDGTLQKAAKRAVQDHGHDAVLAMELKAIARQARKAQRFVRAAVQQGDVEQRSALAAMTRALANVVPMDQVRATADARIAAMRVRDIRPQVYWAAARNAGQAALKAAASGRFELALQEKTKQRLATAMYRAAQDALDEAEATATYATRLTKPGPRARLGKAGDSYVDQVDALLDKFEFATVSLKQLDRRQTLVAWVAQRQEEGYDTSGIPAEVLEAARRVNYRELSVEALRTVRDTLKQIDSMARLKTRLLANKDARDYAAVRDELVAQLEEGRTDKPLPIEYREAETRRHAIATWFASHAKIARLARALDQFKDGGPFWRALIRPLNEAADAEQTRRQAEGTRYAAIVSAHYPGRQLKTWSTKVTVPGVGALSLESRLAVALNWGNETSRQRLLNDPRRNWTQNDVENILATLSRNDWLFVQDTWDYVDTFWQEVSDKQQRVTGLRPTKVEAVAVVTPFGPMRGGYYPLAYDSRMSARAGQVAAATEAKLATHAAYVRTTTKRGHTETRLEHVELPVRLDLGVLFNHVDQVIHDLTHHEVLIDVGRLLRDKAVSQRMVDIAGEPVYKQFTNALSDIATGGKGAANTMDRAAVFMRQGTQVVGMGWNLWTALQQPLGLFNGAARVGPRWIAKGLTRWLRDAATMESTVAWIHDVSPMMKGRMDTATQDLAQLRQTLQKPGGWFDTLLREITRDKVNQQSLTDSYLWHIGLAQRVADVPTWIGAYEKAMASGQPEETAYRLADQAVLDSQGGGQIKDLAAVQRGGEVAKLFMVFYSYGNTMYNSTAEVYGKAQLKTAKGAAQFLGNLSLLYVFPALGTATLAMLLGRDDDDEPFLLEVGQEMLATALNTMVLLRELGGLVRAGSRGYEGPAGTRFVSLIYRLGTQVQQGEADEALWKALNQVAGIVFKYPAGQVQRSIDGWIALEEGRTSNPLAVLVGPPRE